MQACLGAENKCLQQKENGEQLSESLPPKHSASPYCLPTLHSANHLLTPYVVGCIDHFMALNAGCQVKYSSSSSLEISPQ